MKAAICPNFSNKEIKKQFEELEAVVGTVGAYHVWAENNGNPIDKSPNGQDSKLFSDLLKKFNGDRSRAIALKSKTYTNRFKESFGDWVGSSNVSEDKLDDNNEPLLSLIEDIILDESLPLSHYINEGFEERFAEEIASFEARRAEFDKIEYGTEDALTKRINEIKQNIEKGTDVLLFSLKKKYKTDGNDFITSLELQLNNLRNSAIEDITNVALFASRTYDDLIPVVRRLRDIFNNKSAKMSLEELLDLQQNYFQFYKPLMDDCQNTLNSYANFRNLFSSDKEFNSFRDTVIKTKAMVDYGTDMVDQMLSKQAAEKIKQVGISVNSPTILQYMKDNTTTVAQDISWFTANLGAGDKIADEAVKAMVYLVDKADRKTHESTYAKYEKIMKLLSKINPARQRELVELDDNGKPTGYLVRKKKYGKMWKDLREYQQELLESLGLKDLDDLRTCDPILRKKYNVERNKWLSEHCERRFKPEFYELLADLSVEASEARETIQLQIRKIIDPIRDSRGFVDTSKLSDKLRRDLEELKMQKRRLALKYDQYGNKKEGIDLQIAEELSALNEKLKGKLNSKKNKELFNKVLAEKKKAVKDGNMSQEAYSRWYSDNVVKEYAQEFYDELDALEKQEITNPAIKQSIEVYQQQRHDIMSSYRNVKGEFDVSAAPNSVLNKLDKIEFAIAQLSRAGRIKKTKGKSILDIAKFVPTESYKRLQAEYAARGESETFHLLYDYTDIYGNSYPKRYMTKIVPKNQAYILREQPSENFSEISEDSPFFNKNFIREKEEEGEYYIPKQELYDNSDAYNKIMDDPDMKALYEELVQTMEESNNDLTNLDRMSKYRLPQITGSMWKFINSKPGFVAFFKGIWKYFKQNVLHINQEDVEFGGDSIKNLSGMEQFFIPQNFIKSVDDPSLLTANVVGSIIAYYKMSQNFKNKTEIKGDVEAIKTFIKNRTVSTKKGKISGANSNLYKYAENFIKMNLYGMQADIGSVNLLGKEFKVGKFLNKFKQAATTTNLGLNMYCAGTGALTTITRMVLEAITGRSYTAKDYMFGIKTLAWDLIKNNINLLSDTRHNSKQMAIMNLLDIGPEMRFDNLNLSVAQKQIMRNWAFGMYSFFDYCNKGTICASVMHNFKYVGNKFMSREDYMNKFKDNKEMIDAWDNYENAYDILDYKNGKLQVKDKKYQKAWDDSRYRIAAIARNLAQSADGQLSPSQKPIIASTIIGNMLLMHRQYIPLILQERFSMTRQWDYNERRWREAYYRVPFAIAAAVWKDKRNISTWSKIKQHTSQDRVFNSRFLLSEITLLTLFNFVFKPLMRNWADEDMDNMWKQYLAFITVRTSFELTAPYNVPDIMNTIKTPFPAFSLYENTYALIVQALKIPLSLLQAFEPKNPEFNNEFFDEEYDDDIVTRGAYAGKSKTFKTFMKLTPFRHLYEWNDIPSKRRYYEQQISKENQ